MVNLIDTVHQMEDTSAAIFRADEVYRVAKRIVYMANWEKSQHMPEMNDVTLYYHIKGMSEDIQLNDAEVNWLSFLYYLTLSN